MYGRLIEDLNLIPSPCHRRWCNVHQKCLGVLFLIPQIVHNLIDTKQTVQSELRMSNMQRFSNTQKSSFCNGFIRFEQRLNAYRNDAHKWHLLHPIITEGAFYIMIILSVLFGSLDFRKIWKVNFQLVLNSQVNC